MAANQAANPYAERLLNGAADDSLVLVDARDRPADPEITGIEGLEVVGTGPGATLFRAWQAEPRRPVAVRVLHQGASADESLRFERERAVSGQLSGQCLVVPLLESGTTEAGDRYLLTPWYSRGSLQRLVADHGRLGWREAAFLMEPIAVALAEVHSQGLVHRDLTPERVLLTDFLLPRVTGFGLSLPTGTRSTAATLARTPFFSPPELAVPLEADPRADVYGLGAILWSMLTGQVHFAGDTVVLAARTATAQARTGRPLAPVSTAPDSLRDLIARSMSDDPRDRPANAATFVSELRRGVARPNETGSSQTATAASATATAAVPTLDLDRPEGPAVTNGTAATNGTRAAAAASADEARPPAQSAPAGPSPTGPSPTGPSPTGPSPTGPTGSEPAGRPGATRAGHHPAAVTRQRVATALAPTAQAARTDARYVLMLVGAITVAILAMVVAAILAAA